MRPGRRRTPWGILRAVPLVGLLAASLAASLAAPAVAGVPLQVTTQTDPNDTRGKLDIARVIHGQTNLPRKWTVRTYARWTAKEIWDAGYILVFLDTIGSEDPDYYALVRSRFRGGLVASLWKNGDTKDRLLGPLKVGRPNKREVRVEVPFRKLEIGPNRTSYRWSVLTIFQSKVCPRNCFDRAPDAGSVEELYPTP